jgi:hypothetical protein
VSPHAFHRLLHAAAAALAVVALLAQSGCATLSSATPTAAPAPPATAEPPPPNVNLSGFPLPYRQGYADGCASVGRSERKDAARFAADGNYRTGWQDGRSLCAKQ